MSIHARGDMVFVAVPPESGGCGSSHSRPVLEGAPVKSWVLTCPYCETALKDDPCWSRDRLKVPLTPDEESVAKQMEEKGDSVMHQVSAALAKNSIETMRDAERSELERLDKYQSNAELERRYREAEEEIRQLKSAMLDFDAFRKSQIAGKIVQGDVIESADDDIEGIKTHGRWKCKSCGGPLTKMARQGQWPKECLDCSVS
jgi:hypothetical protein